MHVEAWAWLRRVFVRRLAGVLVAVAVLVACSASGTTGTGATARTHAANTQAVPQGTIVYAAPYRGDTALFVLRANGSQPRRIIRWAEAPAWSPDGTRIAYSSTDIGTSIARADGTHARELGSNIGLCYAPAWSPNGRVIACFGPTQADGSMSLTYDDPPSLWLIDVAFGHAARLCACGDTYDGPVEAPTWSPDGTRLAFSDGGVKVIDVKSRRVRVLGAGRSPDWSPDGRQIAYSSGRDIAAGHTIGVMRADGSNRHLIVNSPVEVVDQPAWAPNGKQLIYATFARWGPGWKQGYAGAAHRLRIVSVDGRQVSVLNHRGFEPDWR